MKILVLFLSLFMFSFSGQARTTANKTSKKLTYSQARQKLKGLSLVGYLNTATRLPLTFGAGQVDAKSQNAFGLGAEYKVKMQPKTSKTPVSVIGGLVYETPRDLTAINNAGNQTTFNNVSNPSFSMLLGYANVGFDMTDQAMFFGGLNFPVPFESDFQGISLSGSLGWQTGVAMTFTRSFGMDVSYRWVNLTGNNGLNRIDVDGLQLQGRYIF